MVVPSQWPCPIDDIVIWSYAFDDGDDVVERAHEALANGGLTDGVTADWEQLSDSADAPHRAALVGRMGHGRGRGASGCNRRGAHGLPSGRSPTGAR